MPIRARAVHAESRALTGLRTATVKERTEVGIDVVERLLGSLADHVVWDHLCAMERPVQFFEDPTLMVVKVLYAAEHDYQARFPGLRDAL